MRAGLVRALWAMYESINLLVPIVNFRILHLARVGVNKHHRRHVAIMVIGVPLRESRAIGVAVLTKLMYIC